MGSSFCVVEEMLSSSLDQLKLNPKRVRDFPDGFIDCGCYVVPCALPASGRLRVERQKSACSIWEWLSLVAVAGSQEH